MYSFEIDIPVNYKVGTFFRSLKNILSMYFYFDTFVDRWNISINSEMTCIVHNENKHNPC